MLEYREPFPMAALFDDYTRDLEGHPIVCVTLGLDSALYNSVKGIYQGPSIVWLEYTARMLNATPRSFFTACTMMNYECFSKAIVRKDRFNDLILDTVGVLRVSPSLFTRVDPSSMVIVTPRGSRFTVDELFSNPLSLAVWIVLVVFLVALKILKIFFPSHFKNDLFLVSLCGLEIKSMKKSSSSERMAVTALTIFFFIVLNAYETKLISLMTSKPRNEDIDSIEDLNRTGIAILLPPHKLSKIEEESLNLRFEHISGSMDGDGVLAVGRTYLFDSGSAALLKHMCRGDDKMFSLYKVLDEKVKMTILGNYIFKPDLMDPFARTHKRMVESGLQSFLKDKLAIQNVGGLLRYSYLKRPAEVVTVLDIEDLKPAWVSFGIGLLICCGVFCWEVLVGRGGRHKQERNNVSHLPPSPPGSISNGGKGLEIDCHTFFPNVLGTIYAPESRKRSKTVVPIALLKFFQFNTSQQYSLPSSKPLPCPQIGNLSLLFSTPLKCRINFPFMTSHRGTTPGPKIRRLQPPLARRSSCQTQVIISPLAGDFQKAR
ncbi:conserved hypothetical protein [Culex quinquefasciatus]|uniref:Ionotropic glutamate receptor-invertebrate n=1 Tax=Culex quinquefasciatus TaxID=7176 RepID=B0X2I1_CULQU|nr:conserved hypothetical protein [Culex quinquefasciatus]|eukprot:XP_001863853.1 conserved hypothetical protein [Culex quinquefasciatus]